MKTYPKMKDSGIEWIGEIPEIWKLLKFRRICRLRQGLQIAQEKRFYENSTNRLPYITIKAINAGANYHAQEFIESPNNRVICYPDDVLLARTGATGEVVTDVHGVFHNNFFVIDYDRKKIDKNFLVWYLKNNNLKKRILLMAGTTTIPDLNHDDFLVLPIIVPKHEEQKQIADYLDIETIRIDSEIQKNQKLIKLLKEKRQSTINQAVTKGLDHTVPMKESGIEWIGNIPEHWKITNLDYFTNDVFLGLATTVDYVDEGGIPLIRAKDMSDGKLSFSNTKNISNHQHESITKKHKPKRNDVLVSKSGTLGICTIVDTDREFSIYESIIDISPKNEILEPHFLLWMMRSQAIQNGILHDTVGATVGHLNLDEFKNVKIIVPPSNEQQHIFYYLNKEIEKIDSLISKTQIQIEKLQEYRQSLIFSAVTGKIDVRQEIPA